jgi:transcriptional regulator with XRE-family HTH domain
MTNTDRINEAVAAEVRAHVARQQMRQSDLAGLLGISPSGVSSRLSGRTPLAAGELVVIAEWLGVAPADLIPAKAAS